MDGTLREADGEFRLRFERRLACSLETAWDALTTPATLALWLAEAAIDPVIGGRITLRFANTGIINRGEITEIDRPHILAHSWSSQGATKARLCWELARDPAGSRLVLTHALSERDHVAMIAAGWHAHLDMLDLALAHLPAPWSWRRWEDLRAAYAAALGG